MAQKQHRSLLNAGTFLDFAQKLSSKDRRASSGNPAGSQTSTISHELPSPTTSDPGPAAAAQFAANTDNVSNSPASGDALEHGEEAALMLTSGEISRLSFSNSQAGTPPAGHLRSPETAGPVAVQGQRETLSPEGRVDSLSGSLPSQSGSELSFNSVGNKSSGSPPVVVVVGEKEDEEERLDNSGLDGEAEVGKESRREGGGVMAVALSPTRQSSDVNLREKEVKRSSSLKKSLLRTLKPNKDRRSSGSVSKEGSGIDSESDVDVLTNGSTANLPSPSQSFPNDLPQLEENSSHQGFETSGSSVSSPTDRSQLLIKDDKSIRSGKRKKSSPWYSVLSSSYKTKSDEFRKYFKNIHNSEKLIADYSCALQKDILVQGRMYVTENWLCFYANIFKWETLLTIKMKTITAITKERTIRLIPNAIQIAADNEKYFFTSFMSRDRTFLLLFKVWQNALLDQKMPATEYWTRVHSNYGSNLGLGTDDLPDDYVCPHLISDGTENGETDCDEESKSQGTEGMDEDEELEDGDEEDEEGEEDEGGAEHDSEDPSELESEKRLEVKGQEEEVKQVKVEGALEAAKALDEEGEVASLETKTLDAKEYMNSYFKVTVDDFFAAMYSLEHPFYRNFLIHRKHTDIVVGAWQKENEDSDVRQVSYTLHLGGFKSCGVEERQILHKKWSRPGHSYVVTIEVCQKGVPYADYFYTEARMVITRVSSTSCHVRVNAHLIYKKSAWGIIKGFIEKNADSGVKEKHAELDVYVKQHLSNAVPRAPVATVPKKTKKPRKRKIGAKMEEREEQLRPLNRMESVSNVAPNTNSLSRSLNSLKWMDSKSVMLLICIFLTFLSIVNVSLFLQLQSLEQLAVPSSQDFASTHFTQKLKDVPHSKDQWTSLLEKQLYYHELEMERWREIVGLCIDLMKKMEITLQELHNGIKPVRMPDMEAELNRANVKKPEQT